MKDYKRNEIKGRIRRSWSESHDEIAINKAIEGVIMMKKSFQDYTEGNMFFLALSIITGIGGLFCAFFGPNLIHLAVLYTGSSLYISTPISANIMFALSSVILSAAFFLASKTERNAKLASLPLFLAAIIFGMLWIFNFSALYTDKIVYRTPLSVETVTYEWSDISEGTLLSSNDETPYETVVLTMEDGTKLSFIRNPKFNEVFHVIISLLNQNDITLQTKSR